MNRFHYDDVVNELSRIAIGYGKPMDSQTVDFYMRILKTFDHAQVMPALHESVAVCKHMPRPADIVSIIKANREKTQHVRYIESVDKGKGRKWDPPKAATSRTPCNPKVAMAWMIYHSVTGLHAWNVDVGAMDLDLVEAIVNKQALKHGVPDCIDERYRMTMAEAQAVIDQFKAAKGEGNNVVSIASKGAA